MHQDAQTAQFRKKYPASVIPWTPVRKGSRLSDPLPAMRQCAMFRTLSAYGHAGQQHNHRKTELNLWIHRIITIDELFSESTRDLSNKVCVSSHCLNHLLPDYRVYNNLRLRGHGFQLPAHSTPTVLHRNSFVTRSLYLYVKYLMCVCRIFPIKGCSRLFRIAKYTRPEQFHTHSQWQLPRPRLKIQDQD